MLERLDAKLAAGELTAAEHEAQRVVVLDLIRRGKAVELSPVARILPPALWLLVGAAGLAILIAAGVPLSVLIGVGLVMAAGSGLRSLRRGPG